MPKENAKILAQDFVEGELRGKKSHGLMAFLPFVEKLNKTEAKYTILKETDSFIYIDANGDFGSIIGRTISKKLINKAAKQGVGFASIREMRSWLRPANIAEYIAEHKMIGLVTNTGGVPKISPPGGKEPVVGTNPIGIGIPKENGTVLIDMATSSRAWGEVRVAKQNGHPLPNNAFLDKDGKITTNPDLAHSAIGAGGYKGFGLALFIEILNGAFVNMSMGKTNKSQDYYKRSRGASIMVFNPEFTVGIDRFAHDTELFIQNIASSGTAKDNGTIRIPGENSKQVKARHLVNGYLEIDDELWKKILLMTKQY